MGLTAGTRFGTYEILGPLGAGGMGEVYRARDPRLGREVAIKILPREWTTQPERLRRFEQEGRAASALAHPNILTVHELGTYDGAPFLVTELLEGETLRQRLEEGPVPVRKAIEIGAQVARGLAAAHERGIIHRDLKPDNVFLTRDGRAKILDFGVAKLTVPDQPVAGKGGSGRGAFSEVAPRDRKSRSGAGLASDPDLPATLHMGPLRDAEGEATPIPLTPESGSGAETAAGVILGTLAYMAPEQIRGQGATPSADIFSFGALLYEILAGRRAFSRTTAADTVAAILTEDPPEISGTGRSMPPALGMIVRRCLEKQPEERFHSALDLAFALESLSSFSSSRASAVASRLGELDRARLVRRAVAGFVALLAVLAIFWIGRESGLRRGRANRPLLGGFRQLTDLPGIENFPSISPDGSTVAFDSPAGGKQSVYIQRVGGHNPINLTKESGADDRMASFSPDGARIAFRSDRDGGGLFEMGATGESVRRLTEFGYHPSWSPDAREIVFSTGAVLGPQTVPSSEIWAVEVASGKTRRLFGGGTRAVEPAVSPHGLRVAYWGTIDGRRDVATIPFAGLADDAKPVPVTSDDAVDWAPAWSPDGRFLYFASDRGGAVHLWRVAIDEATGRTRGDFEPLPTAATSAGPFAIARDGRTFVYRAWIDKFDLERLRFDPVRGAIEGPAEVVLRSSWLANPDVSPDGKWLVTNSWRSPVDIWMLSTDGKELRQLTSDPVRDARPVFSPDGSRIAFHSARGGKYGIWTVRPDASALAELVEASDELFFPRWAPDGRRVAAVGEHGPYLISVPAPGDTTSKARAELLPVAGLAKDESFTPWSWAPEGGAIAGYVVGPGDDVDDRGIAVYDLGAKRLDRLTKTGWCPWFLPDGKRILFLDRVSKGQLKMLDLHSRSSRVVLSVPPETPLDVIAPARDFRTIYDTRALGEGDLWLATLEGASPP